MPYLREFNFVILSYVYKKLQTLQPRNLCTYGLCVSNDFFHNDMAYM
jgi:hypothetical protein